jgi:hypothetical protein
MASWEYLTIECTNGGDYILVIPGQDGLAQWLADTFPKCRITLDRNNARPIVTMNNHKNDQACRQAQAALLDHLGSQGWEAYAVKQAEQSSHTTVFLKRSI